MNKNVTSLTLAFSVALGCLLLANSEVLTSHFSPSGQKGFGVKKMEEQYTAALSEFKKEETVGHAILSQEAEEFSATFSPPPPPPANESFSIGTLIIPMDNTYQNAGAAFNLKAYGLVVRLLHAEIPVKWAIKSGKSKDGIDFTVSAKKVAPASSGTANRSFLAGPFIVHPGFESQALSVINSFNSSLLAIKG
ncbi:MAG: hypothetical protein R2788_01050 [Saprospiraceae bacterium]